MAHSLISTILRRWLAILLTVALLGAFGLSVLAESPNSEPEAVSYGEYNEGKEVPFQIFLGLNNTYDSGDQSQALYKIRQVLDEKGYFEAVGVSKSAIPYYDHRLDELTLNAVRECCIRNDCSEFSSNLGVTYGIWYRINDGDIIDLYAPVEEGDGYTEIPFGKGGENLPAIVDRLYELGYIGNRAHNTYDDAVRDALEQFGLNNGLQEYYSHDAEGEVSPISSELQRVLFADDAVAKPKPAKLSLREYLMVKIDILGLKVTRLIVWCLGLLVLVAGIVAAIYFFMPSDGKKDGKAKKNVVHFDIDYQGKAQRSEAEITKTLKIGRGVGNFPLDLTDAKISRRHCELYYMNDTLMLRDYSANGTTINGVPLHNAEAIIKSGDVIVIGEHSITITY